MASNKITLSDHFFRHEYSHLCIQLTNAVGTQHSEEIEDAVQDALLIALEQWQYQGQPDNPTGWLYRVALRKLIDVFRLKKRRQEILSKHGQDILSQYNAENDFKNLTDSEVQEQRDNDLLKMFFVCCDPTIPSESQLVITLKILCGFSPKEIAQRLFITEANCNKRLSRARIFFREHNVIPSTVPLNSLIDRLNSVKKVIYLIFTEGYLSLNTNQNIRQELCEEALRLATLITQSDMNISPEDQGENYALLALMYFHKARLNERINSNEQLILLEEQDRSKWNQDDIHQGLDYLELSAQGNTFSRYHAEAAIAAEHCLAQSFQNTRWDKIVEYYQMIEKSEHSPLIRLNCAIAIAQWKGPAEALSYLGKQSPPSWLQDNYLWYAVHADLFRQTQQYPEFQDFTRKAYQLAPNQVISDALRKRLENG